MSASAHNDFKLRWRWLLPVAVLVILFHVSPFGVELDRALFDAASRRPFRTPELPSDSALVLVDDATLAVLNREPYAKRWPLPRAYFAALFAALDRAGAERIVADFAFLEQAEAAEQDAVLAAVSAALPNLVLARTATQPVAFWPEEFQREHASLFATPRTGLVEFPADKDGVARRYVVRNSLAAGGLPQAPAVPDGLVRWHGTLQQIEKRGVPVIPAGHFVVAGLPIIDRLSEKVPDFSPAGIAQALAEEPRLDDEAARLVRGRVVFVGANASGTFDLKPLPVGPVEPGVLLHWTAWANLRAGGFIAPIGALGTLLVALLAGLVVFTAGVRRASLFAPAIAAVVTAVVLVLGAWTLLSFGWFLPPAPAIAAVGLVLLGVVAENFWREQRRKREIQAMFGAYVDPRVVAQLVRDPDAVALRGGLRTATVFFSDLAGFTDLSEKLPPEQMVEVVNAYLEETSECLHRHGAYVDKYIGDAVMAVLGAPQDLPDHAVAGCRAALEAQQALERINARYAAKSGVRLEVRIGLNTGAMLVGNIGSSRKKNYTVMGDAVNLASRLEGANKAFGTGILLGEETARLVQDVMVTRPLARLRVKGKLQAIEVHTLHGEAGRLPADEKEFVAAYRAGYTAFVERRFAEAAGFLSQALALRPADLTTRRLHQEATAFAHTPPPPEWEPVISLDSK